MIITYANSNWEGKICYTETGVFDNALMTVIPYVPTIIQSRKEYPRDIAFQESGKGIIFRLVET
jgi:hypothetical protein